MKGQMKESKTSRNRISAESIVVSQMHTYQDRVRKQERPVDLEATEPFGRTISGEWSKPRFESEGLVEKQVGH